MRISGDYDVKTDSLKIQADKVTFEVGFHQFDPAEIRRIISKAEDKYFIAVRELQQLEKAGVRRRKDREKFLVRPVRFPRKQYVRQRAFQSGIDI